MLQITNFSKTYKGGKIAVSNLTLNVMQGDILGFIGHNGAGKSTTIKAVVGILDFEQGEITIDNVSIQKQPLKAKQKIAYIPDNPDLYEHLTGIQYLNFVADIFEVTGKKRTEQIQKYAEAFEMTSALGDLISSYSHGMKQKVAIISALIHEPQLLILDEPFVGLDPKASLTLKNAMRDLCASGSAVFFSTHVLEVAEKLCNKIAIIKSGHLVAHGKTQELIQKGSLEELFMEVANEK